MESVLVVPPQVRTAASVIERTVANDDAYLESKDSAFCALTDFRVNISSPWRRTVLSVTRSMT